MHKGNSAFLWGYYRWECAVAPPAALLKDERAIDGLGTENRVGANLFANGPYNRYIAAG